MYNTTIFLKDVVVKSFERVDKQASNKVARRYIRKTLRTTIKDAEVTHIPESKMTKIMFAELPVEVTPEEVIVKDIQEQEDAQETLIAEIIGMAAELNIDEGMNGEVEKLALSYSHKDLLLAAESFNGRKWHTKLRLAQQIIVGIQKTTS